MAENYDYTPKNNPFENPFADRILDRRMFYPGTTSDSKSEDMKILKTPVPRCFIIYRYQRDNLYAGVYFRLMNGVNAKKLPTGYKHYSSLPLEEWIYEKTNSTTKAKVVKVSDKFPPVGDVLGDFIRDHHELICPEVFKDKISLWPDGNWKLDYGVFHAVEAFEVVFRTNPDGSFARNADNTIAYDILPDPWILELTPAWFRQLKDRILQPVVVQAAAAPVSALDEGAKKVEAKNWPMPTTDIRSVLLRMYAREGDDPTKGEANRTYSIEPHPSLIIDIKNLDVAGLPQNKQGFINWHEVYKPMTVEDANRILKRTAARKDQNLEQEEDEAAPPPPPAPPAQPPAAPAAEKVHADDIPF